MQCQQWERAWQEDHASLEATQEQVAQTSTALEAERSRSSTQEEELNKALLEKARLQGELEELRAELLVMREKMAALEEEREQEQDVEKGEEFREEMKDEGVWHTDEVKEAWHEEDPVISGSLLSPTKNYWKPSSWNERSPAASGRSPAEKRRFSNNGRLTETPIKSGQGLPTEGRSSTYDPKSPSSWSVSRRLSSLSSRRLAKDADSGSPKLRVGLENGDVSTSVPAKLDFDSKPSVSDSLVPKSGKIKTPESESSILTSSEPKDADSVSSNSILGPARVKDLDSILLEIENLGVATTPQWRAIQDTCIRADSLERKDYRVGVADPSPLLERSLSGLYRAYDLINTLTSMNVTMQEKMDSLARENTVSIMGGLEPQF